MRAFGADDADAAAAQALQQAGDIGLFTRQAAEIEHHRPTVEERRRALDLRIERIKPVFDRRLRREHERHERAATDSDERTRIGCWHPSGVTSARRARSTGTATDYAARRKSCGYFIISCGKLCWRRIAECELVIDPEPDPPRLRGRAGSSVQAGDSTWITRLAIMSRVFAP